MTTSENTSSMPRGRYKKYLTHDVSEPDTPIIVSRQTRLSQSQQVHINILFIRIWFGSYEPMTMIG